MRRANLEPEQRYQILGRIASGAMGQIYLARVRLEDGKSGEVALKRIKPELQRDRTFLEMFYDEIRIASRMEHPNIIRLLDYGELDGSVFYAMELVAGISLSDLIQESFRRDERIPLPIALTIAILILDALEYAHSFQDEEGAPLHLVHRDVSPQNVLLGFDGAVKLLDFGVTKAEGQLHKTQPGMIKGKLAYMAPEQIASDAVDARTDLFALGVVMYEMMLLQHPFPGATDPAVITSIMRHTPSEPVEIDPRFPRPISEIVMRAIAKDPGQRFESAKAMRGAIHDYLQLRGWETDLEAIERLLAARFGDRIERLSKALFECDDEKLVEALELGKRRSGPVDPSPLPRLLAPPPLPSLPDAQIDDIVPPTRHHSSFVTDDLPPSDLGPYRLLDAVSLGACEIRVAEIERAGVVRRLALKRLAPRRVADRSARSKFVEEIALALDLTHPNLIQVIDANDEPVPHLVMELVEGISLERLLEHCRSRRTRMPVGITCRIFADLCRAVDFIHGRSIFHRSLSSDHVMITEQGDAKLTHPRLTFPAESKYVAPERATDGLGPETAQSDVFSLGILLAECAETMDRASHPPSLADIIERASARAPDRRHESARALAGDLERVLSQRSEPVTPLDVADWLKQLFPGTGARDR